MRTNPHESLEESNNLPDYHGKEFGTPLGLFERLGSVPLTVELRGIAEARRPIGDYVEKVLETLQRAEREIEGFRIVVR